MWADEFECPDSVATDGTILAAAGVGVPVGMQGMSLLPYLKADGAPARESWLYEHFPVFPIPIPGITAVRTDRYKYVEYQNDVRPKELFDLQTDPQEKNNLMDTAAGKKLAQELEKEMERLKEETGYRFHKKG